MKFEVKYKTYLAVFLFVLLAIFTYQNMSVIEVKFLFLKLEMRRSILIFLTLSIGILIGWMLNAYRQNKLWDEFEKKISY